MAFVIAVAQRKGGAGKSTIAANLAAAYAEAGQRVALLDIDPQRSLARWDELRGRAPRRARCTSRRRRGGACPASSTG